ncbi:hypothetical protein ECRN5871_3494 [Escherichia coli RN587/1]|nr:hypothetical protein ECRN5871_3494 [Escherichia coli RN587/1]EII88293.1 hypothetical protein EC3003_2840 [Escherichia coli 3003]EKI25750.1 hypothetical protein ECARS42123_2994 [Escherichia coli ARS4.2123]
MKFYVSGLLGKNNRFIILTQPQDMKKYRRLFKKIEKLIY